MVVMVVMVVVVVVVVEEEEEEEDVAVVISSYALIDRLRPARLTWPTIDDSCASHASNRTSPGETLHSTPSCRGTRGNVMLSTKLVLATVLVM